MTAKMGNMIAAAPYRNRVHSPSMIIEAMGAKSDMIVIEVGCGSGFFTLTVAKDVQSSGIVYAIDIQEGMLEKLRTRMKNEQIENIIPVLADANGHINLDDGIVDVVFSVTVLPEIQDPVNSLFQFKRLMKSEGMHVDAGLLMDPDYPLKCTVKKWATKAGLVPVREASNVKSHILVFRKE
jgi:ubiquinone/menaquinone biosynthesis C-methylase UbiE